MAKGMTGKQRASRIPLDYYKKPDRLTRWKLGLSLVALAAALGWFASGLTFGGPGWVAMGPRARKAASHGPVARVHAAWDSKCEACHAPFTSINGETWSGAIGLKAGESDQKCQACHRVADHAETLKPGDTGSCASCHQDHRGRDASLVSLSDAQCTSCHADLKNHRAEGSKTSGIAEKVTSFPDDHPEFALLKKGAKEAVDPGNLKFNHALHMTPGLNDAKGGKPIFTLGQLAPADRTRYRRSANQPETAPVALNCASCHRLGEGSQPDSRSVASGGDGAYFQPITYKTDCAACHKLEAKIGTKVAEGDAESREPATVMNVPHGLQPGALRQMLVNASIGVAMGEKDGSGKGPRVPLPGRTPAVLTGLPKEEEVLPRAETATRALFGPEKATCTECHHYETPEGTADAIGAKVALSSARIAPTRVPAVWFKNSWFNHSSHRGVSCRDCHAGAYTDSETPSRVSSDVLLVGKEICAKCHAPESSSGATGGAGHSCTECHRYHGGGHGRGTIFEESASRDIAQFLSGAKAK